MEDEALFICKKKDGRTQIDPFTSSGYMFKKTEIDEVFSDEEELTTSERILRGDFDA
jgi:hypothetical protein